MEHTENRQVLQQNETKVMPIAKHQALDASTKGPLRESNPGPLPP